MASKKSKLDAVLQQDQSMQSSGNTSLAYKGVSRKNLKKQQADATRESAPTPTPAVTGPQLLFAQPVTGVKYVDNQPNTIGLCGLALFQHPAAQVTPKPVTLLCYDPQTQQQHTPHIPITPNFQYIVQDNNYFSFWDQNQGLWAVQFASNDALKLFTLYINIIKFQFQSQSEVTSFHTAPQSEVAKARIISNGDTVKVNIQTYLLSTISANIQANIGNTAAELDDILGASLESSQNGQDNFISKTFIVGAAGKKDIYQGIHAGLAAGTYKGIEQCIIAPASLCLDAKETTYIPPHSDLIFFVTVTKAKQGSAPTPTVTEEPEQPIPQPIPQPQTTQATPTEPIAPITSSAEDNKKASLKERMARLSQANGYVIPDSSRPQSSAPIPQETPSSADMDSLQLNASLAPVRLLPLPATQATPEIIIATQPAPAAVQQTPLFSPQTPQHHNHAPSQPQQFSTQPQLQMSHSTQQFGNPHHSQQTPLMSPQPYSHTYNNNPHLQTAPSYNTIPQQYNGQSLLSNLSNNQSQNYHLSNHYNNNMMSPNSMNNAYGNNNYQQQQQQQQQQQGTQLLEHTSARVEHIYVLLSQPQQIPSYMMPSQGDDAPAAPHEPIQLAAGHIINTFQQLLTQNKQLHENLTRLQQQLNTLKKSQSLKNAGKFSLDTDSEDDSDQIAELTQQILQVQKSLKAKTKEYNQLLIKYNTLELSIDGENSSADVSSAKDSKIAELEGVVEKKKAEIEKLKQLLHQKDQQIADKNTQVEVIVEKSDDSEALATKEAQIVELTSKLAQVESELSQKDAEIAEMGMKHTEAIAALESQLQAANDAAIGAANPAVEIDHVPPVLDQSEQILEFKTALTAANEENTQLQTQITQKMAEIAQKDAKITELENASNSSQDLTTSLQESLLAKDADIQAKYSEAEVLRGEITSLQASIAAKDTQIAENLVKLESFKYTEDDYAANYQIGYTAGQTETMVLAKERQQKIISQAKAKMDDLLAQLTEKDTQMEQLKEQCVARIDKFKGIALQLKATNDENVAKVVELEGQTAKLTAHIESVEGNVAQKDVEIAENKESIQKLEDMIVEKDAEIANLRDETKKALELRETSGNDEAAKAALITATLQAELEAKQQEIISLSQKCDEVSTQLSLVTAQQQESAEKLSELQLTQSSSSQELDSYREQFFSKINALNEAQDQYNTLNSQYAQLYDEYDALDARYQNLLATSSSAGQSTPANTSLSAERDEIVQVEELQQDQSQSKPIETLSVQPVLEPAAMVEETQPEPVAMVEETQPEPAAMVEETQPEPAAMVEETQPEPEETQPEPVAVVEDKSRKSKNSKKGKKGKQDDSAAKAKKEKADEKAAQEVAEAQRIAEEAAAEQAKAEAQRIADEAAAEQAKAEAQRIADETAAEQAKAEADKAAAAEAQRIAEEAAAAEAQRIAEEAAAAEAQRIADEAAAAEAQRIADEAAAAEAQRIADEAAAAEAQRIADEAAAEQAKAEAQRIADESAAEQAKTEQERITHEKAAKFPTAKPVASLFGDDDSEDEIVSAPVITPVKTAPPVPAISATPKAQLNKRMSLFGSDDDEQESTLPTLPSTAAASTLSPANALFNPTSSAGLFGGDSDDDEGPVMDIFSSKLPSKANDVTPAPKKTGGGLFDDDLFGDE